MAMGKAIVSTTIGAEGIRATDGRNIVLADDPAEFADKTVKILKSPAMRAGLGSEARKLVESEYSWGIVGKSLQDAYEAVLDRVRANREGRR
jgi:glycosyltransferase involved in cell wall biosynthesis